MEQILIELFNPVHSSERLVRQVATLYSEVDHEIRPNQPRTPVDEYIAHLQFPSKYYKSLRWIAKNQNGEVLGCSHLRFKLVPENPTAARIYFLVSKHHRRRKIGTYLFAPLIEAAQTHGRVDITCTVMENSKGEDFLKYYGATRRDQVIENHLDVTSVKESKLHEILDKYYCFHNRYKLIWWRDICPEDKIKDLANAKMWMNTALRGKRRKEEWSISPEWIREDEARRMEKGIPWLVMAAIEKLTYRMVAFTDVYFPKYRPWIAIQQDTAVDPAHRRKGLASFLKANLIHKLYQEMPDLQVLTTFNSRDNIPIIKINQNLGFIPKYWLGKWEMHIEPVHNQAKSS